MMEQRINIAKLLKDCPKGMELDCSLYDNVTLVQVKEGYDYPIVIETPNGQMLLSKYGCFSKNELAKCIIFPKGETTWEGFHKPFEDGDIVISDHGDIHISKDNSSSYCCKRQNYFDATITTHVKFDRLATEEEKQKLFDAIKDNGYKWNEETKTLEKLVNPRFKIGNKIKYKINQYEYTIIDITKDNYIVRYKTDKFDYHVPFWDEDNYDLVPDKFDVINFEPFMKVLVRSDNSDVWECDFFSSYNPNCSNKFHCIGAWYNICIPYIGNEHLRGTTDDCDDYYKL